MRRIYQRTKRKRTGEALSENEKKSKEHSSLANPERSFAAQMKKQHDAEEAASEKEEKKDDAVDKKNNSFVGQKEENKKIGDTGADIFTPFLDTPESRTKKEEEIRNLVAEGGEVTGWDEERIMRNMIKRGYPAEAVKKAIDSVPPRHRQRDLQEKIKEEKKKQIEKQKIEKETGRIIGVDGSILPTWTENESIHWKGWDMLQYTGKQARTINKLIRMRKKMGYEKKGFRIRRLFDKGDHIDNYTKEEFNLMYRILKWQPHPDPLEAAKGKNKANLYFSVPRYPRGRSYYTQPSKKPYHKLIEENLSEGRIILGEGIDTYHKSKPITLPIHDLFTHTLITGGTGKGKTTLGVQIAIQCMASGANVFVFDPKGELIDGILPLLPESLLQQNRVVIIDPYDTELPVSINPLYLPGLEELKRTGGDRIDDLQGRLKENVVDMLKRTQPVEGGYSPSLNKNLKGVIGACIEAGNTTLVDAFYIIDDKVKRWRLLNMLSKEENKHYLQHLLSDPRHTDDLLSTVNRLHPFFDTAVLKRMLCKRTHPLDFSTLVEPGKIVLIDLRKAKVSGSVGKIMGTVYLIQLWLSIMNKKGVVDAVKGKQNSFPTIAIMDEFQNFTTESFVDILNESRSYDLGLVMLTQYLSQIHPKMIGGLLENVALHIALGVGAEDAKILKDVIGCKEKYLTRLDPFTFYGRAKVGAHTTNAFYGELYHPFRKPLHWELFVKLFYERSREIYGHPYNAMDTSLFGTDVKQIEDMLKAVHCLQIKNSGKNIFYFDEVKTEMERIATMPGLLKIGNLVGVSKSCADQGLMKVDFDEKKVKDEDLPKTERYRAFKYSITQDGMAKLGVDSMMGKSAAAGGPTHRGLIGAARDLTLLLGGDMIVKNQDEGGMEYLPDGEVHIEPVMDGRTPSQQQEIRKMLESKPIYVFSGGRDVYWEIESSTVGVREKIIHNFCKGMRGGCIVFFGAGSEQDGFRIISVIEDFINEGYKKFKISDIKSYEKDTLPRVPTSGDYQVFVLTQPAMVYDMRLGSFKKVRTTMGVGMDVLTFGYSKTLLPVLEKIIEEKKSQLTEKDDSLSEEEKTKILDGPWMVKLQDIWETLEDMGLSSSLSKQDVVNTMKKLGVFALPAPTGHVENTLFTVTKENLGGIRTTLEGEDEETSIRKKEMMGEYDIVSAAKDKIEVQIKKTNTDTIVFKDEKEMQINAGVPWNIVQRFLQYGGANKAEDGKIMVTTESLKQLMGNYKKMLSETSEQKKITMRSDKEDISYHVLLGKYDEYITAKKIDKTEVIKHDMDDFMVEMGIRKEYNVPVDVMEKFNKLLDRHTEEVNKIVLIESSVKDEIRKELEKSASKQALEKVCKYIREEKGIVEGGMMRIGKEEINILLNKNAENTDIIWNILQESPVPGGVINQKTGKILLTLEQFKEFEKQIPLIAQKHMLQEENMDEKEEPQQQQQQQVASAAGNTGRVGNMETTDGDESKNNTVCAQLPGKCYFCGKDLKTNLECAMTKKYGYVCLKCFDEQNLGNETPGLVKEKKEPGEVADAIIKQESMAGLTNEDKILKVFSANPDKLFTIKEISELANLEYPVTVVTLRRLAEKGLVANPNRGKYCYKEQEEQPSKE